MRRSRWHHASCTTSLPSLHRLYHFRFHIYIQVPVPTTPHILSISAISRYISSLVAIIIGLWLWLSGSHTVQCVPISGLGFRRGSYKCVCRKGYYFPDTNMQLKYYNGSTLEEEYEKYMLVSFRRALSFYICKIHRQLKICLSVLRRRRTILCICINSFLVQKQNIPMFAPVCARCTIGLECDEFGAQMFASLQNNCDLLQCNLLTFHACHS